jgi:hypothetical protein
MCEILRGTGRTTRLIEEAKRLQQQGKSVVIVVATVHQVNEVRIKTGNTIPVVHSQSSYWDWDEMRLRGQPLDTEYLIDHLAIEMKYTKVLQALYRFCPPMMEKTIQMDIKPCPFCGGTSVSTREGSTFRWWLAECNECGATAGEVRCKTSGDGTKEDWVKQAGIDALNAWNGRK